MNRFPFSNLTNSLGFIGVTINRVPTFIKASEIVAVWLNTLSDIGGSVIQTRGTDDLFYMNEHVETVFKLIREADCAIVSDVHTGLES